MRTLRNKSAGQESLCIGVYERRAPIAVPYTHFNSFVGSANDFVQLRRDKNNTFVLVSLREILPEWEGAMGRQFAAWSSRKMPYGLDTFSSLAPLGFIGISVSGSNSSRKTALVPFYYPRRYMDKKAAAPGIGARTEKQLVEDYLMGRATHIHPSAILLQPRRAQLRLAGLLGENLIPTAFPIGEWIEGLERSVNISLEKYRERLAEAARV